jgi:hypothetical protein
MMFFLPGEGRWFRWCLLPHRLASALDVLEACLLVEQEKFIRGQWAVHEQRVRHALYPPD